MMHGVQLILALLLECEGNLSWYMNREQYSVHLQVNLHGLSNSELQGEPSSDPSWRAARLRTHEESITS